MISERLAVLADRRSTWFRFRCHESKFILEYLKLPETQPGKNAVWQLDKIVVVGI
jgi:hypothetical protein